MKFNKYIITLFLLASLYGCDWINNPLVTAINDQWPPVDKSAQQQKSIHSSSSALASIEKPDIYAAVNAEIIDSALQSALSGNELGITKVSVKAGNQVLYIELLFDHVFEGDLTAAISGKVSGVVTFSINESASSNAINSGKLELRILPALTTIDIKEIKIAKEYDLDAVVKPINSMLKNYINNINGVISHRPETRIKIPTLLPDPIDPRITSASGTSVEYQGKALTMPALALQDASILITEKGVEILARLQFRAGLPSNTKQKDLRSRDFPSLKKEFNDKKSRTFTDRPASGVVFSINKNKLSEALQIILNPEGEESRLCFAMAVSEQVYSFNKKIGLPDESSIDCTPTRDCGASHIDCTPRRDCTATKDCGGYKWYQAPDKLRCEAEKSAAKLDCERIKSTNKATCEANKSAWKLTCERIKSQQKAVCEAEKEIVKQLALTGNFANIDGTSTVSASLGACLHSIQVSRNLDQLSLTLDVSGTADVATDMKFTPLDIIGHLACQVPWSDRLSLTTTLPEQSIPLTAIFAPVTVKNELYLSVEAKGFTISANMEPSPKEALLKSNNFNISCLPLSGLIRAIDIFAGDTIPDEVNGNIVHKQSPLSFKWPIESINFNRVGVDLVGNISIDKQSVSFYGNIKQ